MNMVLQKKIETKGRKNFQHKLKFTPLEFTQENKDNEIGSMKR
jgi:hypothetical protein